MRRFDDVRLIERVMLTPPTDWSPTHTRDFFMYVWSPRSLPIQRSDMDDNAVLLHESVIRDHHIYKSVWSPTLGEIVSVDREHGNTHDLSL